MSVGIVEKCSCGAEIRVNGSAYRSWEGGGGNVNEPRGAEEVVERWRSDHHHEPPVRPIVRLPRPRMRAVARRRQPLPRDGKETR